MIAFAVVQFRLRSVRVGTRNRVHEWGSSPIGVAQVLPVINGLMQDQAQWPEIIARLNPLDDAEIRRLVLVLRGPHMFVPGVALNILKMECESVARSSPSASICVALEAAVRSMERITRIGD